MDLSRGWEPPKIESKADILSHFDRTKAEARAALEGATAEDLHHRAQLTVYLRLLDVPVPGMYGPSADEQGEM